MRNTAPVGPTTRSRFLPGAAALRAWRPGAAHVTTRVAVVLLVMLLIVMGASAVRSSIGTAVLEPEPFFGIRPLEKRTTSIILVHGIGHHCIGYADPLIASLMKGLAGARIERCNLEGATVNRVRAANLALHGSRLDDLRGADSLKGALIAPDQVVDLALPLFAALKITIAEPAE